MEIWKQITNYEGLYLVSNYGNVKSLKYNKERILKFKSDSQDYKFVSLSKKGIVKHILVHRLVAIEFLENPLHKKEVNHKDFNRSNNFVENLEWVTSQENSDHRWNTIRKTVSLSYL
jgi:hypothetical protein